MHNLDPTGRDCKGDYTFRQLKNIVTVFSINLAKMQGLWIRSLMLISQCSLNLKRKQKKTLKMSN